MSSALKGTVILGYVDVAAAGCRTLLGGFDCNDYEIRPWHLHNLDDEHVSITSGDGESHPVAQILTHKTNDVSLMIISTHIEDDVAHVVADEILDVVTSGVPKEFIVLSSLPTGIEAKSFRIIDKGIVSETFAKLKCGDAFLNSIIQFSLTEQLSFSVLVAEGRKVRNRTTPNEADGSMQCIAALNEALNREYHLDLRLASSLKMAYDGSRRKDEKANLMFF